MKKVIFLVFLLLTTVFLSSCKKEITKIGILIDDYTNESVKEIVDELLTNINSEYEIIMLDANKSQSRQNEDFLYLIEEDVDFFIVSLVDRLVARTYAEKCKNIKKPIIFFNNEPLKEDLEIYENAYYVGYNSEKIGLYQFEMVTSLFYGGTKNLKATYDNNVNNIIEVAAIKSGQGFQASEIAFESCVEELRKREFNVKILATEYANDRQSAKEKIKKIYNDPKNFGFDGGSNIELVIASNDVIALGILDFVKEEKLYDIINDKIRMPFVLIGANCNKESLKEVDYLYATTQSECRLQGQIILDKMESILKNNNTVMNYVECGSENEDEYNFCYDNNSILVTGDALYLKDDKKS